MHKLFNICFLGLPDNLFVELSIGGVGAKNRNWMQLKSLPELKLSTREDCYFGPALRKEPGVMGKSNVACSHVVWCDYDETYESLPQFIAPPSVVVKSGGGVHLYWRLKTMCNDVAILEKINDSLSSSIGGDRAHNADRLLRIPGTLNTKYESDNVVEILKNSPSEYGAHELLLTSSIDDKLHKKIVTGDARGFKSRSERDWHIVRRLVKLGFDDELIVQIFQEHACGDKIQERGGEHYLNQTIDKARNQAEEDSAFLIQKPDGYYTKTRNSLRRVSTFVLHPTLLCVGNEQEHILCDVSADGESNMWRNLSIPQSALTTVRGLSKHLSKAAWAWLGNDSDVRLLRAHLVRMLQEVNMPTAKLTTVLGYHEHENIKYFVGSTFVVNQNSRLWTADERSPILYTSPPQQVPKISVLHSQSDLKEICTKLHLINIPAAIWPMIGWFMATPLKPAIEKLGHRFPILNVFGTRGSGKTSTILGVFQPLLGYEEQRAYSANTTTFVTLSLLACSNAVPISFSEFRAANTGDFLRYVLLSYDTGRDPRGRPDQTTIDYPLTAPFVVDGEDMLDDSAAMERIVAVHLNPNNVKEQTKYWNAFQHIQDTQLRNYTLPYIKHLLRVDLKSELERAHNEVVKAFPMSLPPRIRKNLTVCWLGVLLYRSFVETQIEIEWDCGAKVLEGSLNLIYNTVLGRGVTVADDFIETVVNAASTKLKFFPWREEGGVFWFQLTPAFNYFTGQKARLRKTTLSRQAIRSQLIELLDDYMIQPQVKTLYGKPVLSYGVDLQKAHDAGLDVPTSLSQQTPKITLKRNEEKGND